MVFCIVGIAVFGVLGIFSAKHRRYFRESLHCFKRQMTLRPCDTKFDQEMKAKIAGAISKRSSLAGKFVYKRFNLLSWLMIIMLIGSAGSIGIAAYNTAAYGNCNGPNSTEPCIFSYIIGGNSTASADGSHKEMPSMANEDMAGMQKSG